MVAVTVAALGRFLGLTAGAPGLGVVCGILPKSFASFALALALALEEMADPCDEFLVVLVAVSFFRSLLVRLLTASSVHRMDREPA